MEVREKCVYVCKYVLRNKVFLLLKMMGLLVGLPIFQLKHIILKICNLSLFSIYIKVGCVVEKSFRTDEK